MNFIGNRVNLLMIKRISLHPACAALGMLAFINACLAATTEVETAGVAPGSTSTGASMAFRESKEIDDKVATLLRQMTLEEKAGQLTQFSNGDATGPDNVKVDQNELAARGGIGSVLNLSEAKACNALQRQAVERSRLKIPILFGLDVIHGYRTLYPVPLGLSATWDVAIAERCARMAAVEATADGIRWTFSPMVDIARDARWGRITEGSGEDPCLGSLMAAAWVRGYQGKGLSDPASMLACAKHYVAYGGAEGGREYNSVDISERTLREVYLPPFKAAVDAGAGSIMSAFNSLQGLPASANRQTLTDILRGEWGFRGLVVSDWDSIGELVQHGVALDGREAAFKALTAGVDMDMQSNLYATQLPELVRSGRLTMEAIDRAVTRVLRVKFALDLFERPYTDEKLHAATTLKPEHLEIARQAAEASFVLLKNDPVQGKPILPLAVNKRVALIGPLADSKADMLGAWAAKGQPGNVVTLRQSLAERWKGRLVYAKGTATRDECEAGFDEALAAANKANVVLMALGEGSDMSGEAASRGAFGPAWQASQAAARHRRQRQAGSPGPVQWPPPGDSVGGRARPGHPGSLVPRGAGRTGPRPNPDGRSESGGPAYRDLPTLRRPDAALLRHVPYRPPFARKRPIRDGLHRRAQHASFPVRLGVVLYDFRLFADPDHDTQDQRRGTQRRRRGLGRSHGHELRAACRRRSRATLRLPARDQCRPSDSGIEGLPEDNPRPTRGSPRDVYADAGGTRVLEYRHETNGRTGRVDRVDRSARPRRASGEGDDRAVNGPPSKREDIPANTRRN